MAASITDRIEHASLLSELDMLRGMMDESVSENQRKIQLIEWLNIGLKEHPDKDHVRAAKETIKELIGDLAEKIEHSCDSWRKTEEKQCQ